MNFSSSVRTPCPICGRTSSGCRTQGDLLQCRIGTTCSPLTKHPNLKTGDVIGDWACVSINEDTQCASFKIHEEPVVVATTRFDYYLASGRQVTKKRIDWSSGKKEFKGDSYPLSELLPYKYETLAGLEPGTAVYVVEGEKACDAMREHGFNSIGLPGAGYQPRELEALPGLQLIWCPDRDRKGIECMMRWDAMYGGLWLLAEPHNRVAWEFPSDGFDVADWLPDVHDLDELHKATQATAPVLPVQPWHERVDFGLDKLSKMMPYDVALKLSEQLGDSLRYNLLTDCPEVDGRILQGDDLRLAYISFQAGNLQMDKQQAMDAVIYSARQRAYNPVVEYLDSCNDPLPDEMWANIGGEFIGGSPEEFDNSIVQRWLVHAVRRAYEPGSPFGILLVLVGKQEAGKSRFFEELASREWFNDGFKMSGKEADDVQKLTQSWIAEWGELDGGLKKSNEADIKAFVSRKVDRTREAYGTGTEARERSFVICATTNKESGFFSDETGNRRFALYQIGDGSIDGDKVVKWRDRIWASAVKAYRAGLSIHLSETERDIQRERNRLMFREDPWIMKIQSFLAGKPDVDFVTPTDLLHDDRCIGNQVDRSTSYDLNRVKVALTAIGWVEGRKVISGRNARGFWRPGTTTNTGQVRR